MLLCEVDRSNLVEQRVDVVLHVSRNNEQIIKWLKITFVLGRNDYVNHFCREDVLIHFCQFVHQLKLSECVTTNLLTVEDVPIKFNGHKFAS